MNVSTRILAIEDNLIDIRLLQAFLQKSNNVFDVAFAQTLEDGIKAVDDKEFDIILLDLFLPDSMGINTFRKLQKQASEYPIIILSGLNDEQTAVKAVKEGAQDYLVKDEINPAILVRAIQYAIERKKTQIALTRSEERFRLVMETIEDVFMISTPDYDRFLYVSPGFERLWKCSRESLYASPSSFTERIHPRDLEMIREKFRNKEEDQWAFEYRLLFDDQVVWVSDRRYAVKDADGTIEKVVGVIKDITLKKNYEIALEESEYRYRQESITDVLTGLYNLRHFFTVIVEETARSTRHGRPLSLLMIDIDDFKKCNDLYGHLEGDKVLLQFGRIIQKCIRKSDTAYRYGGEEFAVILPETSVSESFYVAERIRSEVKNGIILREGNKIRITVSIGAVEYDAGESHNDFIRRADQNLYAAKRQGKNKCVVSANVE